MISIKFNRRLMRMTRCICLVDDKYTIDRILQQYPKYVYYAMTAQLVLKIKTHIYWNINLIIYTYIVQY